MYNSDIISEMPYTADIIQDTKKKLHKVYPTADVTKKTLHKVYINTADMLHNTKRTQHL